MYLVYGSSTLNKSTIVSKNQTLIIIYRSWIFGFIFCSFTKTSVFINTYIIRFWIRIIVFRAISSMVFLSAKAPVPPAAVVLMAPVRFPNR